MLSSSCSVKKRSDGIYIAEGGVRRLSASSIRPRSETSPTQTKHVNAVY